MCLFCIIITSIIGITSLLKYITINVCAWGHKMTLLKLCILVVGIHITFATVYPRKCSL